MTWGLWLRDLIARYRDAHRMTRDDHIKANEAAVSRGRERIGLMLSGAPDHVCCPGCALGSVYHDAQAKQERRVQWLCILLRKRNHERDHRRANALEWEWLL